MISSELTKNLHQKLQGVEEHCTTVRKKFKSVVRTRKLPKRHQHRVKVVLKNVSSGIVSSEQQLQQIDTSRRMRDSAIRRRMSEIEQDIDSYARKLERADIYVGKLKDDDYPRPDEKPVPLPVPPSAHSQ